MNTYDRYKEAVLEYAALFKGNEIISMDDGIFKMLSQFLHVDSESIKNSFLKGAFPRRIDNRYSIFGNYVWQCVIEKNIQDIKKDYSYQAIAANYEAYLWVVQSLGTISSNITVYFSLKEGYYTYEKSLHSYGNTMNCSTYLNMLRSFMIEGFYEKYSEYLPLVYNLLDYEIDSFRNLILFINALVLVAESEKIDRALRRIAEQLLDRFFMLLQDTCIVSCKINSAYHDLKLPVYERGRVDQTTLLQMFYYYPNTDAYSLRLDLPHQGVEYIHFNNISPGNTKCFLFSEEEYESIIRQYPQMEGCFIEYSGNRYALMERINCPQDGDVCSIYDEICERYDHNNTFCHDTEEADIVEFFDLLHYLLSDICFQQLDIKSGFTKRYFDYANIMGIKGLSALYLTIADGGSKMKVLEKIVQRAIYYGIITEDEKDDYKSVEGACMIAELAKERAMRWQ